MIPSSARKPKRARTLDVKLFCVDEEIRDDTNSDLNEGEGYQYANVSYYSCGAVSTHTVKPKIHKYRRAKSHTNIDNMDEYNYDSIWNVKTDQIINENDHIEAMMDKPCVTNKRKSKSHNVDINQLS